MKERNKLTLQMSLLFLVVLVVFGVIIVNEKLSPLKIPKVTEKLNVYINDNYKDILNNVEMQEVEYKEMKYQTKLVSKENENYYFYIYYENKKITDTYKKDYVEGQSILNYQKDKIIEHIKKKTKSNYTITMSRTLDKYTDSLKEKIITSNKPESLKIYNLEANITVSKFDTNHITKTIKAFNDNLTSKSINPKTYTLIVTNPDNEDIAVKINNLTSDTIENDDFINIINDIINKKKSNLLSNYDIDYEYLN
ncbi:MAG: hypothetical protein Q4E69_06645 [Bacilli bacterium]|nr:hypothetical protein [Bacilli bacterium]